jgi:hypothetical protein
LGVLAAFDGATAEPNCEARVSTTGAPQALMLLNGEFAVAQAEVFAGRVAKEAGSEANGQVARAWKLAYLREPTEKEVAGALAFLKTSADASRAVPPPAPPKAGAKVPDPPSPEARALAAFCQALLCSNRFLYID